MQGQHFGWFTAAGRVRGARGVVAITLLWTWSGGPATVCAVVPYEITVIAKTGQAGLAGMEREVSINDSGRVAFIGRFTASETSSESVFVGDGLSDPINISPSFSSSSRDFANGVQITAGNKVAARDRASASPIRSFVRIWGPAAGVEVVIARGGNGASDDYDSVIARPSVNNLGRTVFSASYDVPCENKPLCVESKFKLATPNLTAPTPSDPLPPPFNELGDFSVAPRPMIADTGRIVARSGGDSTFPIRVYAYDLQSSTIVSGSLTGIGSSPGISDSGKMLVFFGDPGTGTALYLSYSKDGVTFSPPIRVTGPSGDGVLDRGEAWTDANGNHQIDPGEDSHGFSAFTVDSRVTVNSTHDELKTVTVCYQATKDGAEGIYISRVDIDLQSPTITPQLRVPSKVAAVGDVFDHDGQQLTITNSPSPPVVYDSINNHGEVAFWANTNGGQVIVRANPANQVFVAKEGGVRVRTDVPLNLTDPAPPAVLLFHDSDGNQFPSANEIAVGARNVRTGADLSSIYFTPPAYHSGWPILNGGSQRVDAYLLTANESLFVSDLLEYTEDPVDGVQATLDGVTTAYQEILENDPAEFVSKGPTPGAMAEVILSGIFRRASPSDGYAGSTLVANIENFLPTLRNWLNTNGQALDLQPIVRSPAYGQTIHSIFRYGDDPVLLTLGTGTLVLAPSGTSEPFTPLFGGRLIFPGSLPRTDIILPSEAKGWAFQFHMDDGNGIQIHNASVFRPDRGAMEYFSPRMSVLKVGLVLGTTEVLFPLDKNHLSHIYINPHVMAFIHHDDPPLHEWLVAAVYRYNLDGSTMQENIAKTALIVRQSFSFSEPHVSFEPAHCLNGSQVFPRVSASLSLPVGHSPPSASVTSLVVDYRIALAPERAANSPDLYVAGVFKDLDHFQLCAPRLGLPVPFWANLFDPIGTEAPVQLERFIGAEQADNVHLHHVHLGTVCPWCTMPIVEAPGSFDSFHMHWRWGTEVGPQFGSGEFLFPQNQTWLLGLARYDFPVDPSPDWVQELSARFTGGRLEITTEEKILLLRCAQTSIDFHRQYETFSTGFDVGLGRGPNFVCPLIDDSSKYGGYYAFTLGFGDSVFDIPAAFVDYHLGHLVSGPCGSNAMRATGGESSSDESNFNTTTGFQSLCETVEFPQEMLDNETPLNIQGALSMVSLDTEPVGAMIVADNMFSTSLGLMLTEPLGAPGSVLTITFSPPIRELRHLPVAVKNMVGPAQVRIAMMSGNDVLGDVVFTAAVQPPGQFCEGFADLNPGQLFDRIAIRSEDPAREFGIGRFQVCDIVIRPGDHNRDGFVTVLDLIIQQTCTAGPKIKLGFSCTDPDLDGDTDVDLKDFGQFQNAQTDS